MKMKLIVTAVMAFTMSSTLIAADAPALNTDRDKLSYSVGIDLGKNLKRQDIDINPTVMAKGIQDGMSGGAMLMTEQEMKDTLSKFQKDLMAKRAAQMNKKAETNKIEPKKTEAKKIEPKKIEPKKKKIKLKRKKKNQGVEENEGLPKKEKQL